MLAKDDLIRDRGLPYLGRTITVPCACSNFPEEYCYTTQEFSKERYLMQLKFINLGFKSRIKPQPKANACLSIGTGAYGVDPFGNLYKCWMDIGSFEHSVGRLENTGEVKYNQVEILKWLSYNPFNDNDCAKCKILPLCVGGCYYYPIRLGQKRCCELKYQLKEYLLLCASQIDAQKQNERR
jgi:uncharacterized protein